MTWNLKLKVGFDRIDHDHQRLFEIIGELDSAMRQGRGKEVLTKTFAALEKYTITHFAMEEQFMQRHGYDQYAIHKQQHEALIRKLRELAQGLAAPGAMVTIELSAFLQNWLTNHIGSFDARLAKFLSEKKAA